MKKYLLLLYFVMLFVEVSGQQFNADSLMNIAETNNNDSIRIDAYFALTHRYAIGNVDSLMIYAKKAIVYGQAHHLRHLEAAGNLFAGYAFYRMGNLFQTQTYTLKAAKILDTYPNNLLQGYAANLYSFFQPTDSLQIMYEEKAVVYMGLAGKEGIFRLTTVYGNLSLDFENEHQLDSALVYAQKAYDIIIENGINTGIIAFISARLSKIHSELHQPGLAFAYGKMSLAAAQKSQVALGLDFAYRTMAEYYDSKHQEDSAFYYWSKVYNEPSASFYESKVDAANQLYKYYKKNHKADSALKYASIYIIGNDSLNNIAKAQQIEKINLQENVRQQELADQQAKEKETQKHNIQFALIAIGILIAIILFLLLSRTIMVSHKTVEILGVIVLLIVFEFINLLLHDYLENFTHNSPLLMLLALVAIAALIVPFHHRLEQLATKKLVEKNKVIRLAKAKKIVEQLGDKIS